VAGKVDYTYIGKMERGEQYPSLKMLERIGKAFSVPLGYFFEDHSFLKSLDLLPGEVKDLLRDRKRQDLLKMSRELSARDLDLVMQVVNILDALGSPPRVLSSEDDWLRQMLKIALEALEKSLR